MGLGSRWLGAQPLAVNNTAMSDAPACKAGQQEAQVTKPEHPMAGLGTLCRDLA